MSAKTIHAVQSTLLLPLLIWLPAQAADYAFPGNVPAACQMTGTGSYRCNPLTLAAGATVSVPAPTAITVDGTFDTGANVAINAAGPASNLTLIANGAVTLGANNVFKGSITTNSAAINVGANGNVTGAISTRVAGVITIGADSAVVGDLSTDAGAINVGARSKIDGTLVVAGAGAITLEANAAVTGGLSTDVGAITTGANSMVILNLFAHDGAITVGANATVGGSVCTDKTAAITVGAKTTVGGNVETAHAGAITIGTLARIKGAVIVHGAGARTIGAGATIGTRIGATCGMFDSDGDGIDDSVDEFPNDKDKASSRWYPNSTTYGTVAYEDQWPALGDYDLNDIVVRYRSRQILNAASQVTALEMDIRLDARGGDIRSGFALALPGIAPDNASAKLYQTKGGITTLIDPTVKLAGVTGEDGGVVFEIFRDAMELMPADNSDSCLVKGFSNTGQGCPIQDSAIFKLVVELQPGSGIFPPPPYDPFIFHTHDNGIEIHLPGRQPTSRANLTLMGSGSDGSVFFAGKYNNSYMTKAGLPWALDVPSVWAYPYERLDAINSYPGVAPWANSGGNAGANWYFAPAAANQTFSNGR